MKVLFVDTVHPILKEKLEALGCECFENYNSTKEEIENHIDQYQGLVIRSRFPIDSNFLGKAKNLQFIARSGAGLENIDVKQAESLGIRVFNSPEGNMDAVGEHAIGMLLSLFNHLKKGDYEVKSGLWDREGNRGLELSNKTVGIIGYGNMGKAFTKKLSSFGCTVLAYDKYESGFEDGLVKEVSLAELQNKADVISIHLPLTEETKYYVNSSFIEQCKKSFYLINTARGNHVKIADLNVALKNGSVLGACLDVLEFESKSFDVKNNSEMPEEFNTLCSFNNVVLSPHVAGWTKESYVKLSSYLADKIETEFFK